jgi:hypothetical protein
MAGASAHVYIAVGGTWLATCIHSCRGHLASSLLPVILVPRSATQRHSATAAASAAVIAAAAAACSDCCLPLLPLVLSARLWLLPADFIAAVAGSHL